MCEMPRSMLYEGKGCFFGELKIIPFYAKIWIICRGFFSKIIRGFQEVLI